MDGFAYHKIIVDQAGKPVDYVFLEVNAAFEKLTGLKREKIIGKKVTEVLKGIENDPADWIGRYGRVAITGEAAEFENHAEPLGKWFRVSAYCPEKNYFVALFEDITAHKKAQNALEDSQSRLAAIVDSIADGFYALNREYRFIQINNSALRHFGKTREEVLGHLIFEVFPQVRGGVFEGKLHQAVESSLPVHFEMQSMLSDKIIETHVYPGIEATTVLFRDVTQQKNAQQEIERMASFPKLNPNPVLEVDLECNVKYSNPTTEAMFPDLKISKSCHPFLADWENAVKALTSSEKRSISRDLKIGEHWFYQQLNLLAETNLIRIYAVNIDSLKNAEEALRVSEHRWATTISSIGDAVITTDLDGKVTFLNRVAEELTGWSLVQASQKPVTEVFNIVNENTRSEVESPASRVLKGGVIVGLANHTVLLRKDGTEVPIDDSGAPIKDKNGNVTGVVLVFRDITERKKSEEGLRESERRLNRSQEIAHLGSWELDLVNDKLTWSDEVYRIFGLRPQEFGATYEAFLASVHPDDRKKVDDAYSGSMRKGKDTYEVEHRVIRNDTGEVRTVYEKCEHIRDTSGKIVRSVGMVHDITERKNAEEALRENEIKFRTVANFTYDWEYWIDPDGKLVYTSPSCERVTGYKVAEFMENPALLKQIVHPEDKETNDSHFDLISSKELHNADFRIIRRDGETRWISHACQAVYDNEGKWLGRRASNRDITERKRGEQELWQAKNDWERTFDSVPDFIAILDNKHTIVRVNKAFAKHLGVTPEQAIGLKCYNCVHGTDIPPEFCPHAKTVKDGKEHVAEVHEDRLRGDFLESTTPLKDAQGNMIGSVHVARNITDRKKAEESLRKLNRHLRAVSNSNQALMHASEETRYTKEICDIIVHDCGYALAWVGFAQEDETKTVRPVAFAGNDKSYIDQLNITWDEKNPRGRGPTGTVIRTGKLYILKNMPNDPNFKPWREQAAIRHFTASCVLPLALHDGKIFGALNIYSQEPNPFTDEEVALLSELGNDFAYGIEMLRLRKEGERSEATMRKQAALIDLSPDAIMVRELEGKITFWSKGSENLYGYSKEEAIGQSSHSILKTVFQEPVKEILRDLKNNGQWSGELIHQTKDGRKVVVQSFWQPTFNEKGEITELMESNVDVTDRKQMQLKLEEYAAHLEDLVQERTQQLKDAERLTAIGETAGMVGHDLRNPLQTVAGETYLAKAEIAELPDGEAKTNLQESLHTIAEQIDYMDKIVSDLQDFVKPIKPDMKTISLGNLLTLTIAEVNIPENINIETSIKQDLPELSADAQLLKRVFINLITNAVQAMPKGGYLTVTTQLRKNASGAKRILINMKDTGEGIPEDVKTKIFRPLFTTKSKGQGFGLAVCKRVVEAHGGSITFKSQIGEGSTFTVELPV